jgi:peroxiredoxin
VGTTAPEFELPDAGGQLYRLSDLRATGPVVLVFLRGFM